MNEYDIRQWVRDDDRPRTWPTFCLLLAGVGFVALCVTLVVAAVEGRI